MSTRSYIGIVNDDGTVRSVYHHWDGYISGVGLILYQHYNNIDRINKLLDLGDISSIGTEPVGYWNDGDRDESKCCTYRERGETGVDARTTSEQEFLNFADEDYTYLFKNGEWLVRNWDGPFTKLKAELEKENLI